MNHYEPEKPGGRLAIGALALVFGLLIYVFVAAAIGNAFDTWPLAVQMLYYAVAGIVWIFPARSLLMWMRPAEPSEDQ